MLRTVVLVSVAFLAFPNLALAWWDEAWGYRKAITIDTTQAGVPLTGELRDVSVLLRLHTGNFNHFLDVAEGGADFRVVAGDDKTPLPFHVERFDAVNEIALLWVKLPSLKPDLAPGQPEATGNKIYLYFGNAKAPGASDSATSFGAAEALVYHFDEIGAAPTDRSGSRLPAPAFNGTPVPASLIGGGIRLGSTQRLVIGDHGKLTIDPARGWGLSTWMKIDRAQDNVTVFERAIGKQRLSMVLNGTKLKLSYVDATGTVTESKEADVGLGAWHHLAVVSEGGQFGLLIDGSEVQTLVVVAEPLAGPVIIGSPDDDKPGLEAELDELRIYASVPDRAGIRFAALTQGPDARGIAYLADESTDQEGAGEAGGHSSYFGVILNQVFGNKEAVIEQSVILICAVMALVAFAVMGLKQRYLSRSQSASGRFLSEYEKLGVGPDTDLGALLVNERKFRESPLFRVYRVGLSELGRRVGDGGKRIHGRSLAAIGAAMDAVMVREGQRMNSHMVLLTIAISGGPFIGLLGTVVGVMVTFAAIAASGDVNINAIAPGMAAALLATTAGLAVAIPSLFGYNYLGSRVKELSADMHVFADEFLARINERYGED